MSPFEEMRVTENAGLGALTLSWLGSEITHPKPPKQTKAKTKT